MSEMNKAWVARQEESDESRRFHEQDRLSVWTMDNLAEMMERTNISKADLARKMGCSRSHITQLFAGNRNPTLNTIADIAYALGYRANIGLEKLRDGSFISVPVCAAGDVVTIRRPKVTVSDANFHAVAPCNDDFYLIAKAW